MPAVSSSDNQRDLHSWSNVPGEGAKSPLAPVSRSPPTLDSRRFHSTVLSGEGAAGGNGGHQTCCEPGPTTETEPRGKTERTFCSLLKWSPGPKASLACQALSMNFQLPGREEVGEVSAPRCVHTPPGASIPPPAITSRDQAIRDLLMGCIFGFICSHVVWGLFGNAP